MRSSLSTTSEPWPAEATRANRTASVPYFWVISSGSMTLPLVFDIFCLSASRTSPWIITFRNGTSPIISMPSIVIRATQKNKMSNPVIINDVG